MIKWIQKYFQNKADARKNMMIPTRKPSVKINLKKVKFKRGAVSPDPIPSTHPRPFSEIKPEVPSLQSPQQPINKKSFKTDDIKQKIYQKPSVSYTLLTFIGAVLFFLVAISYVYVNSQSSQRKDYLDQCRDIFAGAIRDGVDLEGVNCNTEQSFLQYLQVGEAREKLELIQQKVDQQQISLQNLNLDLDTQVAQTLEYLSFFEIDPQTLPKQPETTGDTQDSITNKQEYLAKLTSLLEKETGTIQATLSNYETLLETNPSLDLTPEKQFLDEFVAKSQDAQYQSYQELVVKYNELIQTISTSQDNPFVASGLAQPDVFDYKFFSGEEFKQQWYRIQKPNATAVEDVVITGDVSADRRLIQIATDRGYQLQVQANPDALVSLENDLVQPEVKKAFEAMAQAAIADGVGLGVVSGYRSVDTQQDIFLSRFNSASIAQNGVVFDNRAISSGAADSAADLVLQTSSIPGYSKHHSGMALDLMDTSSTADFTLFKDTVAFQWLKANNYYNAKRFGFIPSYPEDAVQQGPEPEAWEYLYVGTSVLLK